MAKIARRRFDPAVANLGPAPSNSFSPMKAYGKPGFAAYGGRIITREKGPSVAGAQRWITYADMVANTSIVAAGVRYFLNIVASSKWTVQPANDKGEAKTIAEFIDSVLNGMDTPWRRIARRTASYRFMGFGVQEWTAKRRPVDGKIGLEDIETRPQSTIDRWQFDDNGVVTGVWQVAPQTGNLVYIPRQKLLYLVEDSLTDSPEGLGLYRHLVEPYLRLQRYLTLEGQGFDRDLRGIPIGRIPYQDIAKRVTAGELTDTEARALTSGIEDFVNIEMKKENTSLVIDSAPYTVQTESGKSLSGLLQYGVELLQGQGSDFGSLAGAIERVNREMARVIGAEHLLLGGEGSANRALAEDKSRNFYQVVNGTLDDIVDQTNKDIIVAVCDLNGIPEELRPKLTHSDISFRSVQEVTGALRDMATAGAVLQPNDPAIDDVRDMLGIERAPEISEEQLALMTGAIEQPSAEPKPAKQPQDGQKGLNGKGGDKVGEAGAEA